MFNLQAFRESEFLRREIHLENAVNYHWNITKSFLSQLHVVYVMTHVGICGGAKIIFEHANRITSEHHRVSIISHFDKPTWFPINDQVEYIQVPFDTELAEGIPTCDVIVATYWREIYECIAREIAPVIYFEQGDYHLFDWENVPPREKNYIQKQFELVPFIYTVSKGAAQQIRGQFSREARVIHNAIDTDIFFAESKPTTRDNDRFKVIMIGSENSAFKRTDDVIAALSAMNRREDGFELVWITPDEPEHPTGEVFVNPPQKHIGDLLRRADCFVSASLYESFSLPVLEAMACGCPVITTRNRGVIEYALNGDNCLMVNMKDPEDISRKILRLKQDASLSDRLKTGGLETASRFTWGEIIPQIIEYYRDIARYTPQK